MTLLKDNQTALCYAVIFVHIRQQVIKYIFKCQMDNGNDDNDLTMNI